MAALETFKMQPEGWPGFPIIPKAIVGYAKRQILTPFLFGRRMILRPKSKILDLTPGRTHCNLVSSLAKIRIWKSSNKGNTRNKLLYLIHSFS